MCDNVLHVRILFLYLPQIYVIKYPQFHINHLADQDFAPRILLVKPEAIRICLLRIISSGCRPISLRPIGLTQPDILITYCKLASRPMPRVSPLTCNADKHTGQSSEGSVLAAGGTALAVFDPVYASIFLMNRVNKST